MMTTNLKIRMIHKDEINNHQDFNFPKIFSILEIHDTPKRRESYYLSRYAIKQALEDFKISLEMDSIILINNKNIHGAPHLTCSISHTTDIACAVISEVKYNLSVGIDIEKLDRPIKKGATKYFLNENDELETYTDLEKWVIKEACYKAFSNLTQKEFLLKDIICQKESSFYNIYEANYYIIKDKNYLTAIAYVPNI